MIFVQTFGIGFPSHLNEILPSYCGALSLVNLTNGWGTLDEPDQAKFFGLVSELRGVCFTLGQFGASNCEFGTVPKMVFSGYI